MDVDSKLDKIDSKIDKLQENINRIDITLASQHESLKTHIKRTDLLEKKLEPVEKRLIAENTILKLVAFAALLFTIVESVLKIKNV